VPLHWHALFLVAHTELSLWSNDVADELITEIESVLHDPLRIARTCEQADTKPVSMAEDL
jgi:hypothetical protein